MYNYFNGQVLWSILWEAWNKTVKIKERYVRQFNSWKWKNRNFAQSVWFGLSIRNGWISFFLFSNQTGCRVWVPVCPGPNKNLFGSTNKVLSGSSVLVQIVLYNMRKQHHNEKLVFLFSNPKYMFDIFS